MSSDLLKTLTVSLTSSFCTALFVVACTAGAEKPPETSAEGGDAATLAALGLRVAELEDFQSSSLCFIGHMTDDSYWDGWRVELEDPRDGAWKDIEWDGSSSGEWEWNQGPNSDAIKAYEDCF